MSVTGYTTIYNEVLRDRTLSLEAKGLFSVIKSFVGLPDFALSKRRLGYACSDSAYLLNAAWKELKQKGYLQHYFSQSENGAFCHVYNLMQHPSEPVDYVYSPSIDRPNGDVACISGAQRDYTNISTSVLRDKTISLASKGHGLVAQDHFPCQQGTVRPRQPSDEDSRLRSPSRGNPCVLHGESETFLDTLEALQDFRSAQAAPLPFRSGESLDLRI